MVKAIEVRDLTNGKSKRISADYFISSMPIKDLISGLYPVPDNRVRKVAEELPYRDFITVGLLLKKLKIIGPENPICIRMIIGSIFRKRM